MNGPASRPLLRAHRATRARRSAFVTILVALCLGLGLDLGLAACSGDTSIAPPAAPADDANARAAAAQVALDRFAAGLREGVADPRLVANGSSTLVPDATANARSLGLSAINLDYVDSDTAGVSTDSQRRWGADTWVGVVNADYRLAPDPGPTQMEIAVTFTRQHGTVRIAAIGGHGHRSPLWMRGAATIVHAGRLWVVDAGGTTARYRRLGLTALRQVGLVLGHWRGPLVLEVPASKTELDSVLDADAATYANIAAVTTTVDGTLAPRSPIHVFLNPAVFSTLREKGAQVVLTHESTHVATKGPLSTMPTWLLEGFADYVALDHAGVPVGTAAHQIIARVRAHGVPSHLPTPADLSPTAGGLGATYEEAWTVCRFLGSAYGEARLVDFYDRVDAGTPLAKAFPASFGVSEATAVAGWRADLARLAGSHVSG